MERPRAPSINRRSRSRHRFRESAGRWVTPAVSRVDLAVGPFVGPNQAVLSRIGPITTRPRPYRVLPVFQVLQARRRHERHASHARGRWLERAAPAAYRNGASDGNCHWAPKRLSVPKSARNQRNLRTSSLRGWPARTCRIAGIPALLERFRSTTENRGVPGSSPGLATWKPRWDRGFLFSGASCRRARSGTRMGPGTRCNSG